jgi:N-acylneuraminate cytidylyltransferase
MNLAIIPARGGSKRIQKKNIKLFHGKPIISYSILTAISSGLFERVIVSSDDDKIIDISKKYGAEVLSKRSSELSDDFTPINSVIKDVLIELGDEALKYKNICCIYACSPFITTDDLINSLNIMEEFSALSCIPVAEFNSSPQRAFKIEKGNRLKWIYPEFRLTRTQDLEKIYHDIGAFAWATKEKWNTGDISDGVAYKVPNNIFIDIDTMEDWKRAELLYEISLNAS